MADFCFKWKVWMIDTCFEHSFKYSNDFQYLKTASGKIMSNQKILTSEKWRQSQKTKIFNKIAKNRFFLLKFWFSFIAFFSIFHENSIFEHFCDFYGFSFSFFRLWRYFALLEPGRPRVNFFIIYFVLFCYDFTWGLYGPWPLNKKVILKQTPGLVTPPLAPLMVIGW